MAVLNLKTAIFYVFLFGDSRWANWFKMRFFFYLGVFRSLNVSNIGD